MSPSISQVENQLANNNVNAGGSFVEEGAQQLNVRALGLYHSVQDIAENTALTTSNGAPVRVKDIAVVDWGPKRSTGHMARADHRPDGVIVDEPGVIQGGVLMRKEAEEGPTLDGDSQKGGRTQQSHPARGCESRSHARPLAICFITRCTRCCATSARG